MNLPLVSDLIGFSLLGYLCWGPWYVLSEGFVLQLCVVDLDDGLILLEEVLSLGPAVFLDAFNVQAQGPFNTNTHTHKQTTHT